MTAALGNKYLGALESLRAAFITAYDAMVLSGVPDAKLLEILALPRSEFMRLYRRLMIGDLPKSPIAHSVMRRMVALYDGWWKNGQRLPKIDGTGNLSWDESCDGLTFDILHPKSAIRLAQMRMMRARLRLSFFTIQRTMKELDSRIKEAREDVKTDKDFPVNQAKLIKKSDSEFEEDEAADGAPDTEDVEAIGDPDFADPADEPDESESPEEEENPDENINGE